MQQLITQSKAYCQEAGIEQSYVIPLMDDQHKTYVEPAYEYIDLAGPYMRIHGNNEFVQNGINYVADYEFFFYADKITTIRKIPMGSPDNELFMVSIVADNEMHKFFFVEEEDASMLSLRLNQWRCKNTNVYT